MQKSWRRLFLLWCILAVVFCTENGQIYGEDIKTSRVLFISSYSLAWETVPQQIDGILEKLGDDTLVDYQFMDMKNVNTDEAKELFYERLRYILKHQASYDVLIVGDDAAFDFAMEHREELFPGIPIIFEGVEDVGKAEAYAKDPLISGVIEKLPYEETIALAKGLYPQAEKITAILDDTVTGQAERQEYYSYENTFPDLDFAEIDASEYTEEELLEQVSKLSENTILLYVICSENADGGYYGDRHVITKICDTADIPVFSVVPHSMGKGFLGGMIPSHKEMGEIAGQMAEMILSGDDPGKLTLKESSPAEACFDEKEMKRFHIRRSQLPADAKIVNHEKKWWEYAVVWWIAIGLLIVVMLVVITRLLAAIRAKNQMNLHILRANEKLKKDTRFDALTGIYNRRALMEDLELLFDKGQPFGVIMYDLDNFKSINDCFGHEQGDAVLKEIARRVGCILDAHTDNYRLGGDEFVLVVKGGRAEVTCWAKLLLEQFGKAFLIGKEKKILHSSIGAALFPEDGREAGELLKAADRAMYRVKKSGKNDFAFYR